MAVRPYARHPVVLLTTAGLVGVLLGWLARARLAGVDRSAGGTGLAGRDSLVGRRPGEEASAGTEPGPGSSRAVGPAGGQRSSGMAADGQRPSGTVEQEQEQEQERGPSPVPGPVPGPVPVPERTVNAPYTAEEPYTGQPRSGPAGERTRNDVPGGTPP